jgi:hypothetical protein
MASAITVAAPDPEAAPPFSCPPRRPITCCSFASLAVHCRMHALLSRGVSETVSTDEGNRCLRTGATAGGLSNWEAFLAPLVSHSSTLVHAFSYQPFTKVL